MLCEKEAKEVQCAEIVSSNQSEESVSVEFDEEFKNLQIHKSDCVPLSENLVRLLLTVLSCALLIFAKTAFY